MSLIQLPLIPGTLAAGVCFTGPNAEQDRLNAYMQASYAQLNGETFFNDGDTEPPVELRSYPWLNPNDGRIYRYNGRWRTPSNYTTEERRIYVGSEADLVTWDGGEVGAPMWEIDHDFDGRSPMGAGAIPTSNPAKTLSVNEDYGEGAHVQTEEELVPHSHDPQEAFSAYAGFVKPGETSSYEITGGTEIERMGSTAPAGGNDDNDAEPANVIHPVRGVYLVKWTGKLWRYAS